MAKPQFDFTANFQYGQHTLSYVLVQVTMNVPLVRVKLLRAINGNPDSYSCLWTQPKTDLHSLSNFCGMRCLGRPLVTCLLLKTAKWRITVCKTANDSDTSAAVLDRWPR